MTAFALTLVLSAAFIHASWNFLAKRAGGGAAFVWLFAALSTIFYAPLAVFIYLWQKPDLGLIQIGFHGRERTDSRGLFSPAAARISDRGPVSCLSSGARNGTHPLHHSGHSFFQRKPFVVSRLREPSWLPAGSFFSPADPALSAEAGNRAIIYGLLTGLLIACYTLWDKYAVSTLLIPASSAGLLHESRAGDHFGACGHEEMGGGSGGMAGAPLGGDRGGSPCPAFVHHGAYGDDYGAGELCGSRAGGEHPDRSGDGISICCPKGRPGGVSRLRQQLYLE